MTNLQEMARLVREELLTLIQPVQLLSVNPSKATGEVSGRFRSNGTLFDYAIKGGTVRYRPLGSGGRKDSADEDHAVGRLDASVSDPMEPLEARLDAIKRKCSTGYGCGSTCISVQKECRSEGGASISKERIQRLEQLAAGEIKPKGIGAPKPADAALRAQSLRRERTAKAGELVFQRQAARAPRPQAPPPRPKTPQIKEGISVKPISINIGGDTEYDPSSEKKKAAGGLKYYRTQRGGQAKQNYFFRDRQAAEHWYADDNAKSDADIEVGAANRRGKEWQAEYRASYEGTRNMLRGASDRELLDTVESYAAAGSATSRGTATDVRIGGNPHSRPIREGTFAGQPSKEQGAEPQKPAAAKKRPTLEEAIASQIQAGAQSRDKIIAELKTYGVHLSEDEAEEILSSDLADMLEAQQMIAAQKRRQAQASSNLLTNPGRRDPGLAPKAKPQGISASEVTTSKQQAQLARQQQAAAKAAGDQRGAEAWRKEERTVERNRLAAALSGKQQSQTSLFGVTEYDETMPLFKQRRDSAGVDPVAQLIGQVLEEQLPGAQVLDWAAYPRGITAGRVASEGLVYRFRCDAAEIGYRPAWEGISERQWEQRSEGFLTARDPSVRVDFKGLKFQQQRSKRKCSKGYGCGSACISLNKECRITPSSATSKARLRALQTLAREGDPAAEQMAASVQAQRDTKAKGLREGRQVDQLKKLLSDPRVAEMVRTGRVPESQAAAPKAGDVRNVSPDGIEVDPERFQYKIGASKTGEVGSLSGVQKWDPNLAGVISVWQDPADGKTYVVNGHNRLGLARRLGAEEVTVRFLKAANAKEARAIGAMQNIAEGAGKDTDAAKFFRDSGITTMEQVKGRGLPLNSGKAERGLALAQLPDEIFQDVIQGNLRTRRAAVIGGSGLDQDKQREVYKVLKQRPSMTDETLQEYVEHLAVSSRQTQTEIDLFGKNTKTVDTGLARAELSNGLKKALGREARLLGAVSKNSQAVELLEQRGGNTINVEQSQQQAQEASSVLRVFNQLKSSGAVGSALDQAAQRLMAGEKRSTVQKELRESVIQAMENELKALGLKKPEPTNEAPTMSMFDSADPIAGLEARLDAIKRKCSTGYACGSTCISPAKDCRSEGKASTGKERLRKLEQAAAGGKVGRGIGQLRGEAAAAKAEEIRGARSVKAASLRQQRGQRPPADSAQQEPGGALVAPHSTTITAPGSAPAGKQRSSLADTFKASVDQMKAADIKQMGILAEQLFETRWTLQKDNEWRGVSKEVARNQFQQDFLKRMQDQSQSPEAQARSRRLQQKMAASGSLSGALGVLLEDMKGSDERIEDLGRKTFELRRQSIDLEAAGDLGPRAGLRGRGNNRRLRGRKDSSDRLDAAIDRLMRISEALTA